MFPPNAPPSPNETLKPYLKGGPPVAIVLAGHNGSGKTTLWYSKFGEILQMPLINADRLTASLLPPADLVKKLPVWAQRLRDHDERWQRLAQTGVQLFMGLASDYRLPFAFETVFSHLQRRPDGPTNRRFP